MSCTSCMYTIGKEATCDMSYACNTSGDRPKEKTNKNSDKPHSRRRKNEEAPTSS